MNIIIVISTDATCSLMHVSVFQLNLWNLVENFAIVMILQGYKHLKNNTVKINYKAKVLRKN